MIDVKFLPERFQKRPYVVDAVQVTATNFLGAAQWSGGTITNNSSRTALTDFAGLNPSEQHIKIPVENTEKVGRETRAYVGDYIVRSTNGNFRVVKAAAFERAFEKVESVQADKPKLYRTNEDIARELAATHERQTWHPETAAEATALFGENTEKVGESAVRSPESIRQADAAKEAYTGIAPTASDVAGPTAPHGEHEVKEELTAEQVQAAADGGRPAEDEPLPDETLNAALTATGVQTQKSRVCDLAVDQEFVYEGRLYVVAAKGDVEVEATSFHTKSSIVFYNPEVLGEKDTDKLPWGIQVITDAVEPIPVGEGSKQPGGHEPRRVAELNVNDVFSMSGREYTVVGKSTNQIDASDNASEEVVWFYPPGSAGAQATARTWEVVVQPIALTEQGELVASIREPVVHEAQPTEVVEPVTDAYASAPKPIDDPGSIV